MVLPALVAGAIAAPVIGGIASFLNSDSARKASAAETAKIQGLLDKIQTPNFSWNDIAPEEYNVVQQYVPQVASYIAEKNPSIIQRSAAGVEGQDAQLNALRRLRGISETGTDAQSDILQEQALKKAMIQNQGQQGQIQQNFASRGMGGSGLEMASKLSAQQGANETGATLSQNAALEAYANKLSALRDSASLGNNIEDTDLNLSSKNTGIINDFNTRTANAQQNYGYNTANTLNDAQKMNITNNQNIANANVGARNAATLMNQQMKNQVEQQNYNNQMSKVNTLRGVASDNSNNIMNAARDQNQAIQGVAGGVSSGLLYAAGNSPTTQSANTSTQFDYNEYLKQKRGMTA